MIYCGIYKITNVLNNKVYIGSSKNIHRRFKQHTLKLNKGKHKNIHLQRSWNKYGEENFEFTIIESFEFTNRKNLKEIEQKYLNKINFKSSYNISKYAEGGLTGPL